MFSFKIQPVERAFKDKTIYAEAFDDIYFSAEDGEKESERVFIEGNDIPSKWKDKADHHGFAIGEMGFGTGLNFLTTWSRWIDCPPGEKPRHLFFVSAELYPLAKEDFLRSASLFPRIYPLAQRLARYYPPLLGGYHPIRLAPDLTLLLMFGDALDMWREFRGKIDVWYLDGFAPAKNPLMWSKELMEQMALLSTPNETVFSTFSVARVVKERLGSVGFYVEKKKGFGRKKEMLSGLFHGQASAMSDTPPHYKRRIENPKIIIIGAGLAGLWTATALRQKGFDSTILEKNSEVARASSGNDVGIISPYFTKRSDPMSAFLMMSFLFVRNFIKDKEHLGRLSGMNQFPKNELQAHRLNAIASSSVYPMELIRKIERSGKSGSAFTDHFFYEMGGYVYPRKLCLFLEKTYGLNIRKNAEASAISFNEKSGKWEISVCGEIEEADILIVASGVSTDYANAYYHIEDTKRLAGFVFSIPNRYAKDISFPIQFGRYATPGEEDTIHFGGVPTEENFYREALHWARDLRRFYPIDEDIKEEDIFYRHCERMTAADHFPIVGFCPNKEEWQKIYSEKHSAPPPFLNGDEQNELIRSTLFLNSCHGSRGISSAPLSAEIIAALIAGEPLPVPLSVLNALRPSRFWARKVKRKPFKF